MNLRRLVSRVALCALGTAAFSSAHAAAYSYSGNFSADNSVFELVIDNTSKQTVTFSTTSFAQGGFVPVLTLFDSTGAVVDNNGSGISDATLTDTLKKGTYDLFLTEFPNGAIGDLADGFLFAADPTATGDVCGVSGGTFLDSAVAPCTQLSSAYALDVTSAKPLGITAIAPTPEPSSLLLMLAPAAGLVWNTRRRLKA